MLDVDAFEFIERCGAYQEPKPLLDDLLEVATQFGFNHLILSGVPMGGQELAPLVELNGWPEGWFDRYIERGYAKTDGVCLYSGASHHPFYWADVPPKILDTPQSRMVQNEASEFGINSGFAVPFLSFHHWQSVVSFASSRTDCTMSPHERAQLVTIASFAGATVEAMVYPDEGEPVLSEREREVLLWVANGKTAWEVGTILGISEVTVKKHLANAKSTLNVATKIQAVVKAVRQRLINP